MLALLRPCIHTPRSISAQRDPLRCICAHSVCTEVEQWLKQGNNPRNRKRPRTREVRSNSSPRKWVYKRTETKIIKDQSEPELEKKRERYQGLDQRSRGPKTPGRTLCLDLNFGDESRASQGSKPQIAGVRLVAHDHLNCSIHSGWLVGFIQDSGPEPWETLSSKRSFGSCWP